MLRESHADRAYSGPGLAVALLLLVALLGAQIGRAPPARLGRGLTRPARPAGGPAAPGAAADVAEAPVTFGDNGFVFGRSVKNDVSPPLRSIQPAAVQPATTIREMPEPAGEDLSTVAQRPPVTDPVVQRAFGSDVFAPPAMPAPIQNFDGVGNMQRRLPARHQRRCRPQPLSCSGSTCSSRSGTRAAHRSTAPPTATPCGSGFGGPCETTQRRRPRRALRPDGRPLAAQPVHRRPAPTASASPSRTTPDPTGAYYRYFFQFSTDGVL